MSDDNNKTLQGESKIVVETVMAIVSNDTITNAAKSLNLDRTTIYDRMNRYPQIKKYIDSIPSQALAALQVGSVKAAETLINGLSDEKHKYDNAKDVLDRVGVGAKGDQTNVQVNIGLPDWAQ